jgi:hypothetical protein
MSWNGTAIATALVGALALAACYQGPRTPPPVVHSVEVAKEACEVDTLAEEHRSIMSRVGTIESGAPTDIKDEGRTILLAKLLEFRAEIDASYRFVTANCNNFNMCMQAHNFQEPFCGDSRRGWMESHERFNELAIRLAELERHHHHGGWPKKPGGGPEHPDKSCECDGSVFTHGCCYDGD